MDTAPQTAGTNTPDTGAPAAADVSKDTLLTAPADAPAAPADAPAAPAGDPPAGTTDPADAKPDEAKPEGAPAEYADFTAPEGMAFNPDMMEEFKAIAREKNLSQADAQKFADLGMKAAQAQRDAFVSQVEQAQAQWAEASKTDKEFGGDKLNENMAVAKKALDTFGTPELSAMLRESGLGNHPEIIRAFVRVGKAISEDRFVAGATKPVVDDVAKKLFPSMN